jgi:hypothetical protein
MMRVEPLVSNYIGEHLVLREGITTAAYPVLAAKVLQGDTILCSYGMRRNLLGF